jgi:hypothetical protein
MTDPPNGDNKARFGLSEALTLASIPGIGFAIVALFQAGQLVYFGVPVGLGTVEPASAFAVLGGMFRIGTTTWLGRVAFVSLLIIATPATPIIGNLPALRAERTNRALRRRPGLLLSLSLLCFAVTPFVRAPLLIWLPAGVLLVSMLGDPKNWSESPGFHIGKWMSIGMYRALIVGLLAVPCAFYSGYILAKIGPNENALREVVVSKSDGQDHTYLLIDSRPENALAVEIYFTKKVDEGLQEWRFVENKNSGEEQTLKSIVFEHLSDPIYQCTEASPISDDKKDGFWEMFRNEFVLYPPMSAHEGTIDMKCGKGAEIDASSVATITPESTSSPHPRPRSLPPVPKKPAASAQVRVDDGASLPPGPYPAEPTRRLHRP